MNDLNPIDKTKSTRFVTKRDMIMVQFTNNNRYANVNRIGDHRYHKAEHLANHIPNPGTPMGVNWYIDDCKNDYMTEGENCTILDDGVNGLKNNACNGRANRSGCTLDVTTR